MSRLSSLSSADTSSTSRSNSSSASSVPSLNRSNSTGLSVADLLQSEPSDPQWQKQEQQQPPQPQLARSENQTPVPIQREKVPIPRQRSSTVSRHNRRVPRACESCRLRKTKCSGDSPVCKLCRDTKTTCVYPLAIREKTNRTISHLSRRLRECEDLLREVEFHVPKFMAERIHALLEKDSDSNLNDTALVEEPSQEDLPLPHLRMRSLGSSVDSLEVVGSLKQHTTMSDGESQSLRYRHDSATLQANTVTHDFTKYPRPSYQFERSASG